MLHPTRAAPAGESNHELCSNCTGWGRGGREKPRFHPESPTSAPKKATELSSARRRDRDGETKAQSVVRCSSGGGCAGVL